MTEITKTVSTSSCAALCLGLISACATVSPGSRPDDMSAAAHRETAANYETEADEHSAEYDPKAKRMRHISSRGGAQEFDPGTTVAYNPTRKHLGHAAELKEHARQHAAAAAALEAFEGTECAAIPKDERPGCPLLGTVERVDEIDGGARLHIGKTAKLADVVSLMKCHYAYGRKAGREGMPGCPLYLKDLTISVSGDRTVDITSENENTVREILERSRAHIGSRPAGE